MLHCALTLKMSFALSGFLKRMDQTGRWKTIQVHSSKSNYFDMHRNTCRVIQWLLLKKLTTGTPIIKNINTWLWNKFKSDAIFIHLENVKQKSIHFTITCTIPYFDITVASISISVVTLIPIWPTNLIFSEKFMYKFFFRAEYKHNIPMYNCVILQFEIYLFWKKNSV